MRHGYQTDEHSIDLAVAFAERFPAPEIGSALVITIDELDAFAEEHGCYDGKQSRREISANRSRMREKINAFARSANWPLRSSHPPFQIEVFIRAKGYRVARVDQSFDTRVTTLPSRLEQFIDGQKNRLKALKASVDPAKITPEMLVLMNYSERSVESATDLIAHTCKALAKEIKELKADIRKQLSAGKRRTIEPGTKPDDDDAPPFVAH